MRSYICLTKKGWIYCTKCIYDTPDECEVKVDLKSKYTRIGGVASDGVLFVTYNNDVSLYIKFRDAVDFSSWLRQMSDFSINTAQTSAATDTVVKEGEQPMLMSAVKRLLLLFCLTFLDIHAIFAALIHPQSGARAVPKRITCELPAPAIPKTICRGVMACRTALRCRT